MADKNLTLELTSTQAQGICPRCTQSSNKIQSHYYRQLTDLNWAEYQLKLKVYLRRFYCPNPACVRRVFCERLPKLTVPHAQRTNRLTT